MRLCLVTSLGLLSTACGLSMNPDLPSTEGEKAPPFGGDTEGPISDGDSAIDLGEGEEAPPTFGSPAATGGAAAGCIGPGGVGGVLDAPTCGDAP